MEKTFTLTMPIAMWQIIGVALENQPYKVAAPVLVEMQKQINEQQTPAVSPS